MPEDQQDQPKRKRGGGPRTPEGKARSSLNALKHGLSARKVVLKSESQEEFDALHAGLTEAWQPVDTMEAAIVADMAAARWRIQRIWSAETTVIDLEMTDQEDAVADKFEYADGETRVALAMKALCSDSGAFALISRYESRHRRAFDRALSNLLRLRKARREEQASRGQEPSPESAGRPDCAQKKVNQRTHAPAAAVESGDADRPSVPPSAGAGSVARLAPEPAGNTRPDKQVPFLQNELAAQWRGPMARDLPLQQSTSPSRGHKGTPTGVCPPTVMKERETTESTETTEKDDQVISVTPVASVVSTLPPFDRTAMRDQLRESVS